MTPTSRVIPSYEYRRTRWRNGAGWTREIHAEPMAGGGGDDWSYRLSIAEITADAPFSAFPGIDRELVLLSGEGMRLRFDDAVVELSPPHGRHRFAGEAAVSGELVGGPTQDFNLMWRRGTWTADLWHRPLVGAMVIFAEPGSRWIVHLLAGQARFADGSGLPDLAMGDTALLEAGGTRLRHVLDGGGEALLIRLSPIDAQPAEGLQFDAAP
ncbi:HutD/Ves family protein [Lysobacter humi (ex Lee et al. 2017)]